MKVLIGTAVNGLYFTAGLASAIIKRTGLAYVVDTYANLSKHKPFNNDRDVVDGMVYVIGDYYSFGYGKLKTFRTDPVIHELFLEFGAIDGKHNKIIEIPDDVDWYIAVSEFDQEYIAEKHRTWN